MTAKDGVDRPRRVERVEAHHLRAGRLGGIVRVDDDDFVAVPHRAQHIEQIRRQQRIDILEHADGVVGQSHQA